MPSSSVHVIFGHDAIFNEHDICVLLSNMAQNALVPGGGVIVGQCPKMMGSVIKNLQFMEQAVEVLVDNIKKDVYVVGLRNVADGPVWSSYDDLAHAARKNLWKPVLPGQMARKVYLTLPTVLGQVAGGFYTGQMVSHGGDAEDHAARVKYPTRFRGTLECDGQTRQTAVVIEAISGNQRVRFGKGLFALSRCDCFVYVGVES